MNQTKHTFPPHGSASAAKPRYRAALMIGASFVLLSGGLSWLCPLWPVGSAPAVLSQPETRPAFATVDLVPLAYSTRYPRGQFQADLRTLLHAVEFILDPWPVGAGDLSGSLS